MAATLHRTRALLVHPFHAVMLASTIPLFLGAVLADWAYASTYHVQWTNFASWLLAGGMVFTGITLLLAFIGLIRGPRDGHQVLYFLVVLATFIIGFINSLVHAKDVWAAMPSGLWLSVIVTLLACIATWIGFSGRRLGGAK